MEMETRLVLKRSPRGEVVATLPMLLPVGATVADVLARAGFGGLDGRSAWVNGREVHARDRVGAQLTVTLFLGPDDPRPRSDGSRTGGALARGDDILEPSREGAYTRAILALAQLEC